MDKFKLGKWKPFEIYTYFFVISAITINAIISHDYWIALVSSVCGITYTILAGKGTPFCYVIGVLGSFFYCILSFKNALWGNLILYGCYYIPMQILGFFQWNKNLKPDSSIVVKTSLTNKSRALYSVISIIVIIFCICLLYYLKDSHPILDSISTVISVLGMYLTVKRAIEQWIAWMIVNSISLVMWIFVVINGTKAVSTVAMWLVYLVLSFYFYFSWKKELKE